MLSSHLPTLVMNDEGEVIGVATRWNIHGLGECIVQYYDGSASSMMFNELDFIYGSEKAKKYLDSKEP